MKIFAIGFNKTGTHSLHRLFLDLHVHSVHSTTPVMEIIDKFDAFTDGSHLNFKDYYNKHPNSLFILNTRPIYKWLVSRYKHAKVHKFAKSWCWPVSDKKTNAWISVRENHYKNVFDFFKDKPYQLMIVNIEKEGWEEAVTKFLQKEPTANKKFHRNQIANESIDDDKMKNIIKNVTNCIKENNYDKDELLIKGVDIESYKFVSFL